MNTNQHEWFSGVQELLELRCSGFEKCITKKWTKNERKMVPFVIRCSWKRLNDSGTRKCLFDIDGNRTANFSSIFCSFFGYEFAP